MSQKSPDCYEIISDPLRKSKRLQISVECFKELLSYGKMLDNLTQAEKEKPGMCSDFRITISERAFSAERMLRILSKETLDTVNELRDSRQLYKVMAESLKYFGDNAEEQFEKQLFDSKKQLEQIIGDDAENFIKETISVVKSQKFQFKVDKDKLIVSKGTDSYNRSVAITTTLEPGQLGRISTEQFFNGKSNAIWKNLDSIKVPEDCHHKFQTIRSTIKRAQTDSYGGVISGLTAANSYFYYHARKMDEVGHSVFNGHDPVTWAVIGIAVVGAVFIAAGAASGNHYLIAFGVVLIVGAALVEFADYILILAIAAA